MSGCWEAVAEKHQVEHDVDVLGVLALGEPDDLVCTDLPQCLSVGGVGGRRNHSRLRRYQKWKDRGAHPAGGPDDQHGLTGLDVGGLDHGASRDSDDRQGSGLLGRDLGWAVSQQGRVSLEHRKLGQGAGAQRWSGGGRDEAELAGDRLAEHLITDAVSRHAGPDLGDRPGEVVSEHVRKLQLHELAEIASDRADIGGVMVAAAIRTRI